MKRRMLWIALIVAVVCVGTIAVLSSARMPDRNELQFAYDLGPSDVRRYPSGFGAEDYVKMVFSADKGARLAASFREFCAEKRLEWSGAPPSDRYGSFYATEKSDSFVNEGYWKVVSTTAGPSAKEPKANPREILLTVVVAQRRPSWLERKLLAIKQSLHLG